MQEDALDIVNFAKEVGNAYAFSNNKLYRKAIIMSILNIGELAKKLPQEFKSAHNEVPWKKIVGMRDVAAHGYHIMDDDIIWDVITKSVPELLIFLQSQLEQDNLRG